MVDSNAFVKGSWGAEIVDELAPQEGDILVEGKRGLDTFASTNLDFILCSRGITTIALGGFLTNCCVESTMRSGLREGLPGSHPHRLPGRHLPRGAQNVIQFDYPMFSQPMTADDFAATLAGSEPKADGSPGY